MAEHLGLRAQRRRRRPGRRHAARPRAHHPADRRWSAAPGWSAAPRCASYPARGARLLRGLSFLSGALDAIAHHRDAVAPRGTGDASSGLPALIVGLADEYDLLTEVGTPDGGPGREDEALAVLRDTPGRSRGPPPRPRARACPGAPRCGRVSTVFPPAPPARAPGPCSASAALVLVAGALRRSGRAARPAVSALGLTVVVFVVAIAVGELFRLRMPSGREAAPLASASALASSSSADIDGEPTFDVAAGFVVLVVAGRAARRRASCGGCRARRSASSRWPPGWSVSASPPGWRARLRPDGRVAVGPRGRHGGAARGWSRSGWSAVAGDRHRRSRSC